MIKNESLGERKMSEEKEPKKLNKRENFFNMNVDDATEEQKSRYSIIALAVAVVWFLVQFFLFGLGIIWYILASALLFSFIRMGLKSKLKILSIIAIVVYVLNTIIYVLIMIGAFAGW